MPLYSVSNTLAGTQQAISAAYKTLVSLTAATTGLRRGKISDISLGTNGTPADNAMEYDISRQTAAGTATAATPNPVDPADGVSSTVAALNATAEPTVTATSSVFQIAVNQRATYRWVASPGSELVWPATNLAGLAVRAKSAAYTGTANAWTLLSE